MACTCRCMFEREFVCDLTEREREEEHARDRREMERNKRGLGGEERVKSSGRERRERERRVRERREREERE